MVVNPGMLLLSKVKVLRIGFVRLRNSRPVQSRERGGRKRPQMRVVYGSESWYVVVIQGEGAVHWLCKAKKLPLLVP